jgi:alpha(1,3/1,4) fucosyltransferase
VNGVAFPLTCALIGPPWVHTHPLFVGLKERLQADGYTVTDVNIGMRHDANAQTLAGCSPQLALFVDAVPDQRMAPKQVLFRFETDVVVPLTWQAPGLKEMDLIFTWDDTLIQEGIPFQKLNFPYDLPHPQAWFHSQPDAAAFLSQKETLLTLINGHKVALMPGELYRERIEWIRYLERHAPHEFHLYGTGWDEMAGLVGKRTPAWTLKRRIRTWLPSFLRARVFDESITFHPYPSYRGSVPDKFETLKRYHFCLCFENAENRLGYITEKLWDALVAGCIPIYRGAPNIEDYFTKACFIHAQDFPSRPALMQHIRTLSTASRQAYLKAGREFLEDTQHPTHRLFDTRHQINSIHHALLTHNFSSS